MKRISLFPVFIAVMLLANLSACNKDDNNSSNTSCSTGACNVPLATGETAGTTPAGIVGTHTLTYHQIATGAPFTDGDQAKFELTSDNKLTVTYKTDCITIENPRQTSPVEVTFPDNCKFNVKFSASESTNGGLNEININALSGQFYGQFR